MSHLLRLSVVVPMHNEQENVRPLLDEAASVLAPLGAFELILVDDGSTDATLERARAWKHEHGAEWLRILALERRGGQSGAVAAGAEGARAPVVGMMDGDMQNDPRDFARMLELVERENWDGASGIRVHRRDSLVRRLSSRIGNGVRNVLTGDRVRDSASGIKVFRREWLLRVPRFNGMHRFLPTLVRYLGGKVIEVPVNHRPRAAGRAKYGIGNRAWRGLQDCMAVRWYRRRLIDPRVREEV